MIWKSAVHPNAIFPDFKVCRWKENGDERMSWMDEPFPKDIEETIFVSTYQDQYDYGSENKNNEELGEFDAFS